MPKRVPGLTNTQVQNAKPRDSEYSLADGKGLYLRVKPNGSRLWIFNYQAPFTKKRSNISFGIYPEVAIAQARSERAVCRELLARDINPKHHRSERDKAQGEAYANTLKAVADKWFKVKSSQISEEYAEDLYNSLENHVFPKLGDRPIHLITAPEMIEVLEPLQDEGKLELVKRICQRLNMIMNYAVRTGILPANILYGIGDAFKAPRKEHLPSIKPEQLPALMESIRDASLKPVTRFAMLWQLHTMVRPSEAAGARWDEINFEEQIWEIPAERMKKRRVHTVPLTPQSLELLESITPLTGHRGFIFPSDRNPRKHVNSSSTNVALRRMGYQGKLVAHGFRSLASTTLNEQGFDPDIIEVALAHMDKDATRAAYNRAEYLERRRAMMYWWSERIEKAAEGIAEVKGKKHLKAV